MSRRNAGSPDAFLFPRPDGHPTRKQTIREGFLREAVKKAGIKSNVSPNSLRHHVAAHLIHAGLNILAVSKMFGHQAPVDHDVYSYPFSD
jgi:site-specific recombinase XerD